MEVISGLTAEEAKSQLVDSLKNEAKTDAMAYIQTTIEEAKAYCPSGGQKDY